MKPWFFAAGIETLVALLVLVALSALSSLLKKRQNRGESLPAPPSIPRRRPQPQSPAPQSKASSWEEELRRLLEGDEPRTAPPPVVVQKRAPAPPPLPGPAPAPVAGRRVPVYETRDDEGRGLAVEMPELTDAAEAYARGDEIDDRVEERLRLGSSFASANAAFEQARQLHKFAAERLRQVREQTPALVAAKKTTRRGVEGSRVVGLIRNPTTVRSVFVASLIFGPTKGLEIDPSAWQR